MHITDSRIADARIRAEAEAAVLREGLEWVLREGGRRLWWYSYSKLPAVIVAAARAAGRDARQPGRSPRPRGHRGALAQAQARRAAR